MGQRRAHGECTVTASSPERGGGQSIGDLSHRSGEGPGCTAVGQGRAHGECTVTASSPERGGGQSIGDLSHRSGEGPGCTAVGQRRAHGEFVQSQLRLPREAVVSP